MLIGNIVNITCVLLKAAPPSPKDIEIKCPYWREITPQIQIKNTAELVKLVMVVHDI
jgi:hypothetical protein